MQAVESEALKYLFNDPKKDCQQIWCDSKINTPFSSLVVVRATRKEVAEEVVRCRHVHLASTPFSRTTSPVVVRVLLLAAFSTPNQVIFNTTMKIVT